MLRRVASKSRTDKIFGSHWPLRAQETAFVCPGKLARSSHVQKVWSGHHHYCRARCFGQGYCRAALQGLSSAHPLTQVHVIHMTVTVLVRLARSGCQGILARDAEPRTGLSRLCITRRCRHWGDLMSEWTLQQHCSTIAVMCANLAAITGGCPRIVCCWGAFAGTLMAH